jgi:hypothetical protein
MNAMHYAIGNSVFSLLPDQPLRLASYSIVATHTASASDRPNKTNDLKNFFHNVPQARVAELATSAIRTIFDHEAHGLFSSKKAKVFWMSGYCNLL